MAIDIASLPLIMLRVGSNATIPAKTQLNIFRYIAYEWIPRHNSPRIVLTDQGLEFRGQDLHNYFRKLGIAHSRSSPFHPQTNRRLERAHRTLKNILRKLTNTQAEKWEDYLAAALMAYRCTRIYGLFMDYLHGKWIYPYFLLYGRMPEAPTQ